MLKVLSQWKLVKMLSSCDMNVVKFYLSTVQPVPAFSFAQTLFVILWTVKQQQIYTVVYIVYQPHEVIFKYCTGSQMKQGLIQDVFWSWFFIFLTHLLYCTLLWPVSYHQVYFSWTIIYLLLLPDLLLSTVDKWLIEDIFINYVNHLVLPFQQMVSIAVCSSYGTVH